MDDVYDDNIEYVITSCPCGNTDGSKYSPVDTASGPVPTVWRWFRSSCAATFA